MREWCWCLRGCLGHVKKRGTRRGQREYELTFCHNGRSSTVPAMPSLSDPIFYTYSRAIGGQWDTIIQEMGNHDMSHFTFYLTTIAIDLIHAISTFENKVAALF